MNPRIFKKIFAALAAATLLAGCAPLSMENANFVPRSKEVEHVTLKIAGEPGQSFAGQIKVDGKLRPIWGVTPVEYPLDVCVLLGEVKKTGGEGTIYVEIVRAASKGSATCRGGNLQKANSKIYFGYNDGGIEVRW